MNNVFGKEAKSQVWEGKLVVRGVPAADADASGCMDSGTGVPVLAVELASFAAARPAAKGSWRRIRCGIRIQVSVRTSLVTTGGWNDGELRRMAQGLTR